MAPTDKLDTVMKFFTTGREWFGDIDLADEEELGLAVKLMKWCACHMGSGGFIPNCLEWNTKTWRKEASIERKIFKKYLGKSEFFRAENGGVRVLIHDQQREAQALKTSMQRHLAALAKWDAYYAANADANADADIQKCRNAEMQNSFPAPPRPTQSTSPRTPTNSALGKLTARETQPADQDDQDEPPTRWGGHGKPTFELVRQIFEMCFQGHGITEREVIETDLAAFWDEKQAHGWLDENGEPMRDWMNCARAYAENRAAAHADASNAPTLAEVQEVMGGVIANPDEGSECAKAFLAGWNTAGNHGGREWQPEAISYAKGWIEPPPGDDEDGQGEDEPDFSDYR